MLLDVVEVAFFSTPVLAQQLHHVLVAFFGQRHCALLLVELEVLGSRAPA